MPRFNFLAFIMILSLPEIIYLVLCLLLHLNASSNFKFDLVVGMSCAAELLYLFIYAFLIILIARKCHF
jgi:hypothetical protein